MKAKPTQKNIPDGWERLRLGDIGKAVIGLTYQPSDVVVSGGTLVFRSSNVQGGRIDYLDQVRVSTPIPESLKVKDGDILICARNGSRSLIGKNALISKKDEGNTFGAFMSVFRTKNPRYIYHFFQSELFKREIGKDLGPTINQVTTGNLHSFKFYFPPPKEQERIVAVLEVWDKAIDKLTKKIKLAKETRNGLFQELLTGKRRLLGFKDKWQEVKFGDLFAERSERGTPGLPLLSITSDRGVIYQSESNKKDTSNSDKSKYLRICPLDIGYNTMRMWQGRSALSQMEGLVSPAYTILAPKKDVDSRYFAYLFKSPRVVSLFFQKSQGLVSDTLQCRYKDFAIIRYIVPSYKEQIAIADVLTTADKEVLELERKLALFMEQKEYLLSNLITGTIRTPEKLSTHN